MGQLAKHILIVEDEEHLGEVLAIKFRDEGFQATYSNDPTEAISLHKKNHFDLIVSDINMPYMSGLNLLKQFRQVDKKVPVIFVSALQEILSEEVRSLGAVDILHKPFPFEQLLSKAKECLFKSR
ncbi:MAG: response regulator [Deltaproteobacteria bacterium]|nr:response regulator [Deltaproteobacteria bacterium]